MDGALVRPRCACLIGQHCLLVMLRAELCNIAQVVGASGADQRVRAPCHTTQHDIPRMNVNGYTSIACFCVTAFIVRVVHCGCVSSFIIGAVRKGSAAAAVGTPVRARRPFDGIHHTIFTTLGGFDASSMWRVCFATIRQSVALWLLLPVDISLADRIAWCTDWELSAWSARTTLHAMLCYANNAMLLTRYAMLTSYTTLPKLFWRRNTTLVCTAWLLLPRQ